MKMIWERMKIIVEPSGAISLAVVLANREKFEGKKIAVILSGGNVDLEKLPWI
jgi:threonine dehydratase